MSQRKIEPVYFNEDGALVLNACADGANDDWIRAARLARAARQGDKAAQEELDRLENTPMYEEVDEDDDK